MEGHEAPADVFWGRHWRVDVILREFGLKHSLMY